MNNDKIGQFISELRKEKHLTQKELAKKLHITDKAVSKWERSLSCPDITLLPPLAEALGVTVSELLNGARDDNALVREEKRAKRKAVIIKKPAAQKAVSLSFSLLLLIAVIVCSVCDVAVSGGFTWSLYPISSCTFAWLVLFPVLRFGKKGILGSLIAISVSTAPFILILGVITENQTLLAPIGLRMTLIGIILLWLVYILFKILKKRPLTAATASLLLLIPACLAVNICLSAFIPEPFIDIWDITAFGIILLAAFVLIMFSRRKENEE